VKATGRYAAEMEKMAGGNVRAMFCPGMFFDGDEGRDKAKSRRNRSPLALGQLGRVISFCPVRLRLAGLFRVPSYSAANIQARAIVDRRLLSLAGAVPAVRRGHLADQLAQLVSQLGIGCDHRSRTADAG
jgi:hypothetical protein